MNNKYKLVKKEFSIFLVGFLLIQPVFGLVSAIDFEDSTSDYTWDYGSSYNDDSADDYTWDYGSGSGDDGLEPTSDYTWDYNSYYDSNDEPSSDYEWYYYSDDDFTGLVESDDCWDECAYIGKIEYSGSSYRICGDYDSDCCLEWSNWKIDDSNDDNDCWDECAYSGKHECSGTSGRTCGDYDSDCCLEWSSWNSATVIVIIAETEHVIHPAERLLTIVQVIAGLIVGMNVLTQESMNVLVLQAELVVTMILIVA